MESNKVFFNHYFKVFDSKGKNLLVIATFFILLVMKGLYFAPELQGFEEKVVISGIETRDTISMVIVPLICMIILISSFYKDYENESYRIMTFLNKGQVNKSIIYRLLIYIGLMVIMDIIYLIINYYYVLDGYSGIIGLIIKFIPPLLFMLTSSIAILVTLKNIPLTLVIPTTYMLGDLFSMGRYTSVFAVIDSNLVVVIRNVNYYYCNKIFLFLASCFFLYLIIKKTKEI